MKYISAILVFVGTSILSVHAESLGDLYAVKACEGFRTGALICVSPEFLASCPYLLTCESLLTHRSSYVVGIPKDR